MYYTYKCIQGECEKCNEEVSVNKPMSESSEPEFCKECGHEMLRVYTNPGIKTAGDGYKS